MALEPSANLNIVSVGLSLNDTTEVARGTIDECKVFNIFMLSLVLCVLTVTTILYCVSYFNHSRRQKRAGAYEAAAACDPEDAPVDLKSVRRSQSVCNPPNDDSSIYYIYSNPLPEGCHEDEGCCTHAIHSTLTLNPPQSGTVPESPTFHMQL
ncbi:uncharacterized protein si:dkey-246e1.3 [Trichomycterus rosablanca]|uniref:uncharacterized protein si:dkey-246e1.3 n=1 Tax=Trichomycterus rosablanca TaxID=2290929 RepID=UPI002F350747